MNAPVLHRTVITKNVTGLLTPYQTILYFIELKGGDIFKALEQLDNSVKLINPTRKFECHIVKSNGAGGIPSFNTKFQILKKKFKKLGGEIFKPHSNTFTVEI